MLLQYNRLMMANYQRVIQLLEKFQKAQYVRYVEQQLKILGEDPLFINLLSVAVRDKNINHKCKLAAAIYLNKTISQNYNTFREEMVIGLITEILLDFSVDLKYKKTLEKSFVSLIELAEEGLIDQLIQKFYFQLYSEAIIEEENGFASEIKVEEPSQSHNNLKIQVLFFFYQCINSSSNHLALLCSHLTHNLRNILSKVQISNNQYNIKTLCQMNSFFGSFIERITQSQQSLIDEYADELCQSEIMIGWVSQQLNLQGTPKQCWISFNARDDNQLLNDLKTGAGEVYMHILVQFSKNPKQEIFVSKKHYQFCGLLINTLTTYAAFRAHLSAYEEFIHVLIRNLTLLFQMNLPQFSSIYATAIHSIVFPMLKIQEEQMILFEDQPQQFNRLAEDCCDHQKYDSVKSQAAKLLQTICDENDQAAQYVIQHCIISLKVRLALDQSFQNQAQNFLPIETALLILSIQSYKLSKYDNELDELRNIFKFQNIKGRLSNLELNRLFTFFAYNYSEIYKNPIEGEIWINQALLSDTHPCVQIAALDFISNVVEEYFNFQFLLTFGNRTLTKNISYLTTFLKIISLHMTKISQAQMIVLIQIVFKLIAREEDLYQKKKRPHKMDIIACLHLLRKIIDKGDYCNDKPNLKRAIWNVLSFLPKLQQIALDDELVTIVVSFIKKTQFVTEEILMTLSHFIKIYQQDRQESSSYLIYFNSIVMKSNHQVALHIGHVLLQTFAKLHHDVTLNPRMIDAKTSLGSILLILQNIIGIYGNDLGDAFIDKISNLSLSVIPLSDNPEDKIEYILVARALNLLFLCHMHKRNEVALRKLLAFQDSPLFQGHDLKVLCLCFSREIFRESDIIAVTEMINLMVKAITLSRQQSISVKSKKNPLSIKPSSTKIRIKRIEDYEKILKFIKTPFAENTIVQLQLKKIIETMKKNNPLLYQGIIKSMNQKVVDQLKQIMSEVTVEGQKRRVVHVGSIKENGRNNYADIIRKNIKKRSHLQQQQNDDKQEQFESKKRNLHKKKLKNQLVK